MKLFVRAALLLNVRAHHPFVPVLAHRVSVIPVRPKLTSPELLLDLRTTLKHLSGRQALYQRHDLGHAVSWYRLHQKVNVILIGAYFQELDLIPALDRQTHFFDRLIDLGIDDRSPILRWKDQMIEQYRDVMTLVQIDAHRANLLHAASGGEFTLRD
jgi:hypothetical protein